MYQFKIAETTDIEAMTTFFRAVYKPGHIMGDREYLMWQYRDVPENQFFPRLSTLLLLDQGTIVGHVGMIPYIFKVNEKKVRGTHLSSLIVREDLRSQGTGVFLLREAEKYFDVLYVVGFNKQAAPALTLTNYSKEVRLLRWIYKPTSERKAIENLEVVRIERFGNEWDAGWRKLARQFGVTISRSAEYLNWRFTNHPKIKYDIFGCEQDGRGGYIALRLEFGNEYKALRIVDVVASQENARVLFAKAKEAGEEAGVDFIDFFCNTNMYEEALKQAGFYLYDAEKNPEPPLFLIPTDRKRTFINFTYKFVSAEIEASPTDWYITKADGDKDRP